MAQIAMPIRAGLALTLALAARSASAAGPVSVLPAANTVPGWKQIGATRTYDRNNLYQLVDGDAEAINAYTFSQVAHAEYGTGAKPAITIDVYQVSDSLNAYGLFSSDRLSPSHINIGVEGVRIGETGLSFWKDRFVVRLAIVEKNPSAADKSAEEKYARAAAAKISGGGGPPLVIQALPAGRQAHSEKFTLKNVAGHGFLSNAVSARYPSSGQGAELFIATYASPTAAKTALEDYRKFEASGTGLSPLKGIGDTAFGVQDKYAKNVVVAQKGRYLVFAIRCKDPASAQSLVKQAIAKVK